MNHSVHDESMRAISRRRFVQGSAALAALGVSGAAMPRSRAPASSGLKIGVIGCGGRGTGAAVNALEASPDAALVALADVFPDRLAGCRAALGSLEGGLSERVHISDDRCFVGFDAFERLLAADIDLVILTSPPHFRPMHLAAAVARGKHVFMEKPVAVDPAGIRSVLASAEVARQKQLAIVAGTQRRHQASYLETMSRIREGAIGRVVSAQCYWKQGGLWMNPRQATWSDMEWQLRNWLYFTWLSGDHIVEQHVHNLDVVNWALGAHPVRATGVGGRQVRIDPAYGHVFDHFAVEYEYPGGVIVTSFCQQIDGCASRVEEVFHGTEGAGRTSPGAGRIEGRREWTFSGPDNEPYVQEHIDLMASISAGRPLNEAVQVAEATMTAIMGRMSAYTGKSVSWEQAMNSALDLTPPRYEMGSLSVAEVAIPGRTPLV